MGVTQSSDPAVLEWFANVNKAFLADLVIDLVRIGAGDECLDGMDLVRALKEADEPIREVRARAVRKARKGAE
jgi:hypothetical protein